MRTLLKPLADRYPASRKDHRNPESCSDWESQMLALTLMQFHVLRNSIDSLKTMTAVRRRDGEYGLR